MTLPPDARAIIVGLVFANIAAVLLLIREPWHAFTVSLIPLGYTARLYILEELQPRLRRRANGGGGR